MRYIALVILLFTGQLFSQGISLPPALPPAIPDEKQNWTPKFEIVKASHSVILLAGGDVMLDRKIQQIASAKGPEYLFSGLKPVLEKADILFCNLEAMIDDGGGKIRVRKDYNFHASADMFKVVGLAGFNAVSIANNHTMDYGINPVKTTIAFCDAANVACFGAGETETDARRPLILELGFPPFRAGFLAYAQGYADTLVASGDRPGVAQLNIETMFPDVKELKKQVDFVGVSLHWGVEFSRKPTKRQRWIAHKLIDSGADIVIGHHPHVTQGVEVYKGRLILYSLGNLLFDMNNYGSGLSFVVAVKIVDGKIAKAQIIPVDKFERFLPKPASGDSRKAILDDVRKMSAELNSANPKALSLVGLD